MSELSTQGSVISSFRYCIRTILAKVAALSFPIPGEYVACRLENKIYTSMQKSAQVAITFLLLTVFPWFEQLAGKLWSSEIEHGVNVSSDPTMVWK